MRTISLKLPEDMIQITGQYAERLHVSRAEYIRSAIERMNRKIHASLRAQQLAEASKKVREESMRVNAEFAAIENDPDV